MPPEEAHLATPPPARNRQQHKLPYDTIHAAASRLLSVAPIFLKRPSCHPLGPTGTRRLTSKCRSLQLCFPGLFHVAEARAA